MKTMERATKAEFELIPRGGQSSFALREFRLPAFSSPWHFHPEYELTYIMRSRGRRFVGDDIGRFGPGDLVLIGTNLPHFWHNDVIEKKAHAHSVVIQFRSDCLGSEFLSQPELSGVRKLFQRSQRGIQFTGPVCDAVGALMRKMLTMSGMERILGFLTVLQKLENAPGRELSSRGFAPSLNERAAGRVNQVCQWVLANFSGPLDHNVIASQSGMSRSALCHCFKRVTGRTLTDFIMEIRIGNTRKLLIETDRSIAEIAYESGFESLSNFNHNFRKLTRISPKEYRREHHMAQEENSRGAPTASAGK